MSPAGVKGDGPAAGLSAESVMDMYRDMVRIREFDKTIKGVFLEGKIPGSVHMYFGEEAVAVGVMSALDEGDFVASTHRGHGHVLARGGDPKSMMAEILGREAGYCHGKGGSMHLADYRRGMLGANGIVGGGITLATGAALACQYLETDAVAVSFFGDGAANRGTFLEALNLAALWDLPALYVCENNLFGEWTRQDQAMKLCDIAGRGTSLGVSSTAIDGNDIEKVYAAAAAAVAKARRGEGPSFIECKTWRQDPHEIGYPARERTEEESTAWLKKDPITRCARKLVEKAYASEDDLKRVQVDAHEEMAEALEYAESCAFPAATEALTDVFSD